MDEQRVMSTGNSPQSTVHSQQSTVNSEQPTVNNAEQSTVNSDSQHSSDTASGIMVASTSNEERRSKGALGACETCCKPATSVKV